MYDPVGHYNGQSDPRRSFFASATNPGAATNTPATAALPSFLAGGGNSNAWAYTASNPQPAAAQNNAAASFDFSHQPQQQLQTPHMGNNMPDVNRPRINRLPEPANEMQNQLLQQTDNDAEEDEYIDDVDDMDDLLRQWNTSMPSASDPVA